MTVRFRLRKISDLTGADLKVRDAVQKSAMDMAEELSKKLGKSVDLDIVQELYLGKPKFSVRLAVFRDPLTTFATGTVSDALVYVNRTVELSASFIGHDYLFLDKSLQGQGLSDTILAFSKTVSEGVNSLGIKGMTLENISLTANLDAGGYVWLRKGVTPDFEAVRMIVEDAYISQSLKTKFLDKTDDELKKFFLTDEFAKDYKKVFMGSEWYGTVDLTNKKQTAVFFKGSGGGGGASTTRLADGRPSGMGGAEVYDRYVDYAANLQRVDAQIRMDVRAYLKKVERDLIEALNDIDPTSPTRSAYREARLTQLLKEVKAILAEDYDRINGAVLNDLKELAGVEGRFAAKAINSHIGVELMSTAITPTLAKTIASDVLIVGAPSEEWWGRQAAALAERFKDQVRRGMLQGETLSQISQRIRGQATGRRTAYYTAAGDLRYDTEFSGGIMDISRREADTLIRTSVQAVSQAARMESYKQNDDIIKGVQALAVLDNRTSDICMARSGMMWTLEGEPIGDADPWPGDPPWHYNCRTTLVPVLMSWEELAPDDKKEMARLADEAGQEVESMQASMDGPVDASMNYEDWLETKPESFQRELLGPTKYRLWSEDKISLRDLIDQTGNPMSVSDLEEKFG